MLRLCYSCKCCSSASLHCSERTQQTSCADFFVLVQTGWSSVQLVFGECKGQIVLPLETSVESVGFTGPWTWWDPWIQAGGQYYICKSDYQRINQCPKSAAKGLVKPHVNLLPLILLHIMPLKFSEPIGEVSVSTKQIENSDFSPLVFSPWDPTISRFLAWLVRLSMVDAKTLAERSGWAGNHTRFPICWHTFQKKRTDFDWRLFHELFWFLISMIDLINSICYFCKEHLIDWVWITYLQHGFGRVNRTWQPFAPIVMWAVYMAKMSDADQSRQQ